MPECTIEIKDEVNVKIHDLDLVTRRQLEKKFKYFLPHAFHVPAYKLGRWDGCVSFFSVGGVTYLNFCLLYTSPSPRDGLLSRMPSSA